MQLIFYEPQGPVGCLACPARFERATSALEAVKMRLNNEIKLLAIGAAYTPKILVRGGMAWI